MCLVASADEQKWSFAASHHFMVLVIWLHTAGVQFSERALVCVIVPIGTVHRSKKTANLAALAPCLVASTVNL